MSLLAGVSIALLLGGAPDISAVKPDLRVPPLTEQMPAAGRRFREQLGGYADTSLYHIVYLPTDWQPGGSYPVLVELPGNGGYRNRFDDVCTGLPDGCKLGYGASGGRQFIWVSLPFVSGDSREIAIKWWGDPPDHDPQPTIDYCLSAVESVCQKFGGDRQRLFLTGFSRGAIACNYIGLHNDRIASLWRGFIVYSHYDGVNENWGYPEADRESANTRLRRLGERPQFICHESTDGRFGLGSTRDFLQTTKFEGNFTFTETGFRNHNDAWILRPSRARDRLREWLADCVK